MTRATYELLSHFGSRYASRIDFVLVSHPDIAHIGALPHAVSKLGVMIPLSCGMLLVMCQTATPFSSATFFLLLYTVFHAHHRLPRVNVCSSDSLPNFLCCRCLRPVLPDLRHGGGAQHGPALPLRCGVGETCGATLIHKKKQSFMRAGLIINQGFIPAMCGFPSSLRRSRNDRWPRGRIWPGTRPPPTLWTKLTTCVGCGASLSFVWVCSVWLRVVGIFQAFNNVRKVRYAEEIDLPGSCSLESPLLLMLLRARRSSCL